MDLAAKEKTDPLLPLAALPVAAHSSGLIPSARPQPTAHLVSGFVFSSAAFGLGPENPRLALAASEPELHRPPPDANLNNALGIGAEVRQTCIGVNCFGEEITSTTNDRTKFATYNRDSYTGLDYADQRYYASTYGRFLTPDSSGQGVRLANPTSWDRYVYVKDDPINRFDRTGLADTATVIAGGCGQGTTCVAPPQLSITMVGGGSSPTSYVLAGAGQVVIGGAVVYGAINAEFASGGFLTSLTLSGGFAGLGSMYAGAANIAYGLTGNQNFLQASSALNAATTLPGLFGLIGGLTTGDAASNVFNIGSSALGVATGEDVWLNTLSALSTGWSMTLAPGQGQPTYFSAVPVYDSSGNLLYSVINTPPMDVQGTQQFVSYDGPVPGWVFGSGGGGFGGGGGGQAGDEDDDN